MHQKTSQFCTQTIYIFVVAGLLSMVASLSGQEFEQHFSESYLDSSQTVSSPAAEYYDDEALPCEHGCGESDCRFGGCRGESHLTIRDMWQREYAAGNEPQHFSYDTRRMYYYRRPYNTYHVREARSLDKTTVGFDGQHVRGRSHYQSRAEIFASVNREVEARYDRSYEEIEDGQLEYVDWEDHQDAKKTWQQDRLSEAESESTDNEETRRANSIRQSMRQLRPPSSLR